MTPRVRTLGKALLLLGVLLIAAVLLVLRFPLDLATGLTRIHLWRAHAHSRYTEVNGYRIHFYEVSPPSGGPGTPLVLVHGLGARSEDWAPLIPGLAAAGFHVYALDLLGYGRSAHPDVDYSITLEEQIVAGFLDAVGLEHTDIIGWSMGGWITMKLALDHPALIDRVVLYDSAGVYFNATYDFSVFTPQDTAGVTHLLALLMPRPPKLPGFLMQAVLRRLESNAWVNRRSVVAMTSGRDLLDFHLYALHHPTLIVWGEQDTLIPLSSGKEIHKLVPGSILAVVPGCGHLAPAQCSVPVLHETVEFLHATPPMPGGEIILPAGQNKR